MKKNDWLLFGSVIVIACIILSGYRMFTTKGTYVEVVRDGVVTERYRLSEDIEVAIETAYGINVLRIQDGYASVIEADCPDKLCVKQKEIMNAGESLICLPHRLVIRVIGSEKETEIDAVAG
ncbi:MAG: NusG domain II-containing protein [Lachnospiraceae bacterium]|nr:NusG domain II-containing protein [Lachnospiraceae bacterium]